MTTVNELIEQLIDLRDDFEGGGDCQIYAMFTRGETDIKTAKDLTVTRDLLMGANDKLFASIVAADDDLDVLSQNSPIFPPHVKPCHKGIYLCSTNKKRWYAFNWNGYEWAQTKKDLWRGGFFSHVNQELYWFGLSEMAPGQATGQGTS